MPKEHATPANPLDAAARDAFREYCDSLPGELAEASDIHRVDRRTLERIYSGKRDVPPGLAKEIATREHDYAASFDDQAAMHRAKAMLAWAESRSVA